MAIYKLSDSALLTRTTYTSFLAGNEAYKGPITVDYIVIGGGAGGNSYGGGGGAGGLRSTVTATGGGGTIESEHMSTIVPASPPGPEIVNVVNGDGFDIVNVPPPFCGSGEPVGQ